MEADLMILEVTIPGIKGNLEGRLLYSNESGEDTSDTGMVICPPHPLLAGNLDNNVVQAVALKLARSMPVLVFNYPAVGKSAKPRPELPLFEYWNELDQGNDYGMVIDEVKQVIAWSAGYFSRLHLVGYSFGAHMALSAISPQTLSYSAIAPPLIEYDFTPIQSLAIPACLIMAEDDSLLTTPAKLPAQENITKTTIRGTNHFFLKHEDEITALIADFVLALR